MSDIFLSIDWNVDPQAFSIFGRPIVWYGILWATGVALTSIVVSYMFKNEKYPEDWFDSFFLHVVVALIIGARLGHCLFYDPVEYLSSPLDLLKVWEGGLSSHGGAIGMLIGVCIFSIKQTKTKVNWKLLIGASIAGAVIGGTAHALIPTSQAISKLDIDNLLYGRIIMGLCIGLCIALIYNSSPMSIKMLDRLIVGVCIGATCIRLGNLMNSEIYGGHTTLPWGFNFLRDPHWYTAGALPCHPTQLYEALVYFSLFLITMFLYWKTNAKDKTGLLLGISLVGIFGSRILIETIKNVQVAFEENMILNLGQILSIPFVLWGIYLIYHSLKSKEVIDNNNKTTNNIHNVKTN